MAHLVSRLLAFYLPFFQHPFFSLLLPEALVPLVSNTRRDLTPVYNFHVKEGPENIELEDSGCSQSRALLWTGLFVSLSLGFLSAL